MPIKRFICNASMRINHNNKGRFIRSISYAESTLKLK